MNEKIAVGVLLFLLRQAGASESDIPTMLAIAQMESGFTDNIEGKVNDNGTRDVGIWQVNAEEYWHDSKGTNDNSKGPDDFTRMWMEANGGVLSLDEFRNKIRTDIVYSTQFASDVVKYRERNDDDFKEGKFSAWSVWKDFIQPYVEEGKTDIRGISPGRQPDMDLAVKYIEDFDSIEAMEYKGEAPPITPTSVPTPGELGEIDQPNVNFPRMGNSMQGQDFDSYSKTYKQVQQIMLSQVNNQRLGAGKGKIEVPEQKKNPEFLDFAKEAFEILSGIRHFDKSGDKSNLLWTNDMSEPKGYKPIWTDDMPEPKQVPLKDKDDR